MVGSSVSRVLEAACVDVELLKEATVEVEVEVEGGAPAHWSQAEGGL